jgi:hypothetical protein
LHCVAADFLQRGFFLPHLVADAEMKIRLRLQLSMIGVCLASTGCADSSPHPMAPVRGTVSLQGKPLASGSVVFRRVASGQNKKMGKAGYAQIKPDGNFVVGTYGDDDGAIVGDHYVMVNCPSEESEGKNRRFIKIGLTGRKFKVLANQVNVFNIYLTSDDIRRSNQAQSRSRGND